MDYGDVVQAGCALLVIIGFGFMAFKLEIIPLSLVPVMNRFLLRVCYYCLIGRSLARRDLSELEFTPFFVGALTTVTLHIISGVIFLFPFKDPYKNYLSTVLPCAFVNYLVVGIPIFASIWGPDGDVMISIIALSNDLVTVPIYLVMSNIYLVLRQGKSEAAAQSEVKCEGSSPEQGQEVLGMEEPAREQENVIETEESCEKAVQLHEEEEDDIEDLPGEVQEAEKTAKHGQIGVGRVLKTILLQIITNPIIIGNVIGFIWSASGLPFPTFFQSLATFLGDEVLGLCLICIGGFIARYSIFACHWLKLVVALIMRHVLIPAITLGYCYALSVPNKLARQCIIMTVLPTGTSSFLLSSASGIGPGVSSTMVFWSTVMSIPFVVLWLLVIDKLGLFPTDE